ncbi:MAG: alpha/beta hydrolase [Clostridia bacterium]|nr:alpha/beta hydrolase [Clostridia bacterium]
MEEKKNFEEYTEEPAPEETDVIPDVDPAEASTAKEEKKPLSRRAKIIIAISGALLLALVIAVAVYLGTYYRADDEAIEAFTASGVYESRDADGNLVFAPEAPIAGFIFYPGGKVEHTAYTPLMRALAENGVLCVLVKMPFNLAIFDTGAAGGIKERFETVERWYIGGHSLGGSMAAAYADDHAHDFDGVILLGSYSTADLSDTELEVLSVYGSEDKVLNAEKYAANLENLPDGYEERVIEGGCHAYFGMYGAQDGDGTPTLTPEEQINYTATIISIFIVL